METTFTDKLIEKIRKTQVELEKFQLQFALGKADAMDKYEELKKKLHTLLGETRRKIKENKEAGKEKAGRIRQLLQELQVQLALGKAVSLETFKAQRQQIQHKLGEVEAALGTAGLRADAEARLRDELEKFKIKSEIIRLRFELNRKKAKEEFEARLREVRKKMEKKEKNSGGQWEHFRDELSEAYGHLKNAFVKS